MTRWLSSTRPGCLLIADDLTGACDAAVYFAAAGARTTVAVTPEAAGGEAEVLAVSTESRDLSPADACKAIREVAARFANVPGSLIFKKIDSTLRGNTGIEVVAAFHEFGGDAAVITPAFPRMARVVENGKLRVTSDASFRPVDIEPWLRSSGAAMCRHVPQGGIAGAIAEGVQFISLDAVSEEDLSNITAEVLALRRRIVWAGSGGLAGALAGRLGSPGTPLSLPAIRGPVLFCLGSDHRVTMAQQERLLASPGVAILHAATASADEVGSVLAGGRHLVLRVPRGEVPEARLRLLLPECDPAALVLCGGDTASLVCRALGVPAIEPRRELAPGIPAGILRGGVWDGRTLVTKSGGFGAPGDLVRIGDHFRA